MVNRVTLDVKDFQTEMKRIEEEVTILANSEIEEKIDYATNQLRIVTPVDTGEARSGWRYNIKRIGRRFYDGTIINNVEHIEYLNRGHSKQAPKYFIEQVLIKIGILN